MTKAFSVLALSLGLASQAAAFSPVTTPVAPSGGLQLGVPQIVGTTVAQGYVPDGAVTQIPNTETVLAIHQIDLLVGNTLEPCTAGATGWAAGGDCFEAAMPGGEVRRFHAQGGFLARHTIDGYTYSGAGVITVEYVETINAVSCMPSGPDGCRFYHYTLVTQ